jgi:hypothetical protein
LESAPALGDFRPVRVLAELSYTASLFLSRHME